eukprot:4836953-Amphidinium_carterae.1
MEGVLATLSLLLTLVRLAAASRYCQAHLDFLGGYLGGCASQRWRPWPRSDYKVKWDSALHHCQGAAEARPDFQGLEVGLATQALRQLKLHGQCRKDNAKTALRAALGGVWHEARVHAEFGDFCVRCG